MSLKKVLSAIVITNLLWGILPIPAVDAMKVYSLFTMIFFRLIYASLSCIIIVALIRGRSSTVKGIGAYVTSVNKAYKRFSVPQLVSLAIVGFMISVSLALLFFSYNLVGVIISTMISEVLTPVLIAFWSWAKGTEKMDILKGVYMASLVLAVIVISVARVEVDVAIKPIGFLYVGISAVFWTLFIVLIAKDTPSKKEYEVADFSSGSYKMARSTLKLGITFLFGGLVLFPLTIVLPPIARLPELTAQCSRFYTDLSANFFSAATDPSILSLSFLLTLVPYLLLYAAQAFWPKEALTFDQWTAILGLITPLVASYAGIFVIGEAIRMDYTLIATAFLLGSIALRYFHEISNKVVGFIFMEIDVAKKDNVYKHLRTIRELREIYAITGKESDVYSEVVTSNLNQLHLLVSQRIKTITGIKKSTLLLVQKMMEPTRKKGKLKPENRRLESSIK
jgi:DNA-binding Lrp family transcriptional regulator